LIRPPAVDCLLYYYTVRIDPLPSRGLIGVVQLLDASGTVSPLALGLQGQAVGPPGPPFTNAEEAKDAH
jgi:hypothetical protein